MDIFFFFFFFVAKEKDGRFINVNNYHVNLSKYCTYRYNLKAFPRSYTFKRRSGFSFRLAWHMPCLHTACCTFTKAILYSSRPSLCTSSSSFLSLLLLLSWSKSCLPSPYHHLLWNSLCRINARKREGEMQMKKLNSLKFVLKFQSFVKDEIWVLRGFSFLLQCVLSFNHFSIKNFNQSNALWIETLCLYFVCCRCRRDRFLSFQLYVIYTHF